MITNMLFNGNSANLIFRENQVLPEKFNGPDKLRAADACRGHKVQTLPALYGRTPVLPASVSSSSYASRSTTRRITLLNWRTLYRAVRTKNAAIAFLRFQYSMTSFAFIEPLTCIGGHDFRLNMTTLRTGDDRL